MQMNDENIQTEEIKQASRAEFKFPDDAESIDQDQTRQQKLWQEKPQKKQNTELFAEHRQETWHVTCKTGKLTQAAKEE